MTFRSFLRSMFTVLDALVTEAVVLRHSRFVARLMLSAGYMWNAHSASN